MEPSPSPRLARASGPELSALRVIPAEGELTETKQPVPRLHGGEGAKVKRHWGAVGTPKKSALILPKRELYPASPSLR